jgi:hypothetical protein
VKLFRLKSKKPLTGVVTFHLHPTFKKTVAPVLAKENKAELELVAWGAFTVGVSCDDGGTELELDLATIPDAPATFRTR